MPDTHLQPSRDEIAFIDGFREVAPRYDVVFCDVWGVLHDGLVGFPDAAEALRLFRAGGGTVVLVSNAPRPGSAVTAQLDGLGVDRRAYDTIVTSGDLTRNIVAERRGRVLHHIGPARDLPIFDGLEVAFGAVTEADYVVCSGLFDDERETVDDYAGTLGTMRRRGLEMVCANPDIVVERGDQLILCAGALAAAFAEIGGRVHYPGKPHRPVYEAASAAATALRGPAATPARILAIGDAIHTDIAGARGFGIDALLVARGIHAIELGYASGALDADRARTWLSTRKVRPNAVLPQLAW